MALPNDPIMLLSMINLKPRCVPGFPLWGTPMTPSAINLCDNRRMLP